MMGNENLKPSHRTPQNLIHAIYLDILSMALRKLGAPNASRSLTAGGDKAHLWSQFSSASSLQ
jgi:hypothetical protein